MFKVIECIFYGTLIVTVQISAYTIRPALMSEVPELLALDRQISYEFFKPLFVQQYSDFHLGQHPDEVLEEDLIKDEQTFPHYIMMHDLKRLYVACNDDGIIGFILFHQDGGMVKVDLLMVAPYDRRKGVAKALLKTACTEFTGVTQCAVVSLDKSPACGFYEAIGFVHIDRDATYIYQNMSEIIYNLPIYRYYECSIHDLLEK